MLEDLGGLEEGVSCFLGMSGEKLPGRLLWKALNRESKQVKSTKDFFFDDLRWYRGKEFR